jgi:nicotinamidase-related amidase
MEAAIFHAVARDQPTRFESKGQPVVTEWFSVLGPEVEEVGGKRVGRFHEDLFRELMTYDRVYVFGEASSHCVLSTLRDLDERIHAEDPQLADKIYILTDAMSPVPAPPLDPLPPALDFPRVAEKALAELEARGMHLVTTQDSIA